jgi:hypothetical protein
MVKISILIISILLELFSFELNVNPKVADINEPIYLSIDSNSTILPFSISIDGVNILQIDERNFVLTSDRNFTIPSINFEYIEESRLKSYKSKEIDIKIVASDIKPLLDIDYSYYLNLMLRYYDYLLVFIFGFWISRFVKFSKKEPKNSLKEKIKRAKSIKELEKLLLSKATTIEFIELIEELRARRNIRAIKNKSVTLLESMDSKS